MNNLSKRQLALVSISKKAKTTVDVGCDHGYIGVELLKSKKTNFLIATDISAPSAQKTQKLLSQEKLESKASVRVGDGLETIKNENINQVIIAGMGGLEICKILKNYKHLDKIDYFVFQPMNELYKFREFLNQNNLKIIKDFIIFDKQKFYHIITAKVGSQKITTYQKKWGTKREQRTNDYFLWIKQKYEKIKNITKGLPSGSEKEIDFHQCLKEIEKILKTKGAKTC